MRFASLQICNFKIAAEKQFYYLLYNNLKYYIIFNAFAFKKIFIQLSNLKFSCSFQRTAFILHSKNNN